MNSFRNAFKSLVVILGMVLALAVVSPVARAGVDNQLTQLTFNKSVELPGHQTLRPGTYWFKLMDNGAAVRNTMVVYNADRSAVKAIVLTRPTYRNNITNHTELTLAANGSRKAAAPLTLVKWFYPASNEGRALVYSSHVQRQIREERMMNVFAKTAPMVNG